MGNLTKNGYEYYKTLDCWEPIEAALIVCGIDPSGVNYENIPKEVWDVYANAAVDYNAEHQTANLLLFPEKNIMDPDKIEKYRNYCTKYCNDQDRFNTLKLKCFHPPFYVSIIKDFHDVDPLLEIVSDPNSQPRYRWKNEAQYDETKPTSEFIVNPNYVFEEEEDPDNILPIYEEMKKQKCWTLDEGILLLGCPLFVHKDWETYEYDGYEYSLGSSLCRFFTRAIDTGVLTVYGTEKEKPRDGWRNNYGCRYINPAEFLAFVQENDLLNIPSALELKKQEVDAISNHSPQQKNNIQKKEPLQDSKNIDYSTKTKSVLKEMINQWLTTGMTRRQIALKLYQKDFENGVKIETLKKRVDRIRSSNTDLS